MRSTPYRREEGAVAVIVALMLVVLMAAVALAVDAGGLYLRRRELVNGADAAALAAARSCARGVGNDMPFAPDPEHAADSQAQANAPITNAEVAPLNATLPPDGCVQPSQYGRVSVQYTSEQALHFAPVLGFNNSSPVTTAATASWGFGSNNSVPMVLSNLFVNTCPMPPAGYPTIGQRCAFWFDNDALGNGNFTFLSLAADGWDVNPGATCNQSGGASLLTDWIDGTVPASVVLNWTEPTYVCSDSGIKGTGNNSNSQVWSAAQELADRHAIRDFPINWEGPGAPPPSTTSQGTIYKNSQIHKYDIIGFAAMEFIDVMNSNEVQTGSPDGAQCQKTTQNNTTIPAGIYTWRAFGLAVGCNANKLPPDGATLDTLTVTEIGNLQTPAGYTFDNVHITLNSPIPGKSGVDFTWGINATYNECGPPPGDHANMCIILGWQGSTLTGDYSQPQDNITVVRLCDETLLNCLDQRHAAPVP